MSQSTLVLVVPPAEREPLRKRLAGTDYEFRSVPHALFSVKGPEVVATLYKSGKLVIQGGEPQLWAERFLGGAAQPAKAKAKAAGAAKAAASGEVDPRRPCVGSDECGKGDYFGPLVVVAARLEPEQARRLVELGVTDSKRLTDERALRIAAALRPMLPHSVQSLLPEDYNREYARVGQLNELLADLHARAIGELAESGDQVVVDRFANERLLAQRLPQLGKRLLQFTKAERFPAVAAASVLARSEFLLALRELSEEFDVDLHKGAGAPTDRAGVAFARRHGLEALGKVAKLHFKNSAKIGARL